jgi:fido (protein-threonine AMPylation protein)
MAAAPAARLADSLERLAELQSRGRRVFRSSEFSRVHRERLVANGFLREAIRGWLICSGPGYSPGDTTPWFASFWEFCATYCTDRFGDQWHVSPEQSLLLHAANTTVPQQIIIYAARGMNNTLDLPFGMSLYDLKSTMPPARDLTELDGIRLSTPEAALTKVSAAFLERNPVEAHVVLAGIRDITDLLRRMLVDGNSVIAGRLAGAFRKVGRDDAADEILQTMRAAGFDVRETDPFSPDQVFRISHAAPSPIARRLEWLWDSMRSPVLSIFPEPPGLPPDSDAYLRSVDETYQSDAYNSLSIEGYRVSTELVTRIRSGTWDPDRREADRQSRDALAARGYWQTFQRVRATVEAIITGGDAADLVRTAHRDWYRELFQPCVAAGLLEPSTLAGYRDHFVYLRGSRHVPPRPEAVRDAMPVLFDLLAAEAEPAVRAVLGHWLLGYIHPYPDGNGRVARFLMNALLAAGGYPWTVVQVRNRATYMAALESASTDSDIRPFTTFLTTCMLKSAD